MIADFEDFVTWMFVTIDDVWQQIAPVYDRAGPAPTSCSDSELITIAIVSECRGWDRETHLMAEWHPYRHLFPRLPERSRYNRRRRNLMFAINQIRQMIVAGLDVAQDAYGAIDGLPLPLPVMHFHLAPQRSRDWDAHGATFGYCASKKQIYFGYHLNLVITLGGVILKKYRQRIRPISFLEGKDVGAVSRMIQETGRNIDNVYVFFLFLRGKRLAQCQE